MERIALRDLRNHASRVVRRAHAGERIIITVDGVPTAQIVPLDVTPVEATMDDLVTQGRVLAPRVASAPPPAQPIDLPGVPALSDVVQEQRDG